MCESLDTICGSRGGGGEEARGSRWGVGRGSDFRFCENVFGGRSEGFGDGGL